MYLPRSDPPSQRGERPIRSVVRSAAPGRRETARRDGLRERNQPSVAYVRFDDRPTVATVGRRGNGEGAFGGSPGVGTRGPRLNAEIAEDADVERARCSASGRGRGRLIYLNRDGPRRGPLYRIYVGRFSHCPTAGYWQPTAIFLGIVRSGAKSDREISIVVTLEPRRRYPREKQTSAQYSTAARSAALYVPA